MTSKLRKGSRELAAREVASTIATARLQGSGVLYGQGGGPAAGADGIEPDRAALAQQRELNRQAGVGGRTGKLQSDRRRDRAERPASDKPGFVFGPKISGLLRAQLGQRPEHAKPQATGDPVALPQGHGATASANEALRPPRFLRNSADPNIDHQEAERRRELNAMAAPYIQRPRAGPRRPAVAAGTDHDPFNSI
jgi:hypothetical protein